MIRGANGQTRCAFSCAVTLIFLGSIFLLMGIVYLAVDLMRTLGLIFTLGSIGCILIGVLCCAYSMNQAKEQAREAMEQQQSGPMISGLIPGQNVAGNYMNQPPPAGPYSQQTGSYQPSQQVGSYQPSQQVGSYQPSQQTGSYQPLQQAGSYQPSQPAGSYQLSQQTGSNQPLQQAGSHRGNPPQRRYPSEHQQEQAGSSYHQHSPPSAPLISSSEDSHAPTTVMGSAPPSYDDVVFGSKHTT